MLDLNDVQARYYRGQTASDPAIAFAAINDVPALVAELRAAREVIREAALGHSYGRMTNEFVLALRAYQQVFGEAIS